MVVGVLVALRSGGVRRVRGADDDVVVVAA